MFFNRAKNRKSAESRNSSRSSKRRPHGRLLRLESLESRAMLSATVAPKMVAAVAPKVVVPHQIAIPPTANIGILLLDHSGGQSLLRTGNGGIFVPNGDIVIDSSNSQAGLITGNGNVSANHIYAVGGLKHFGKGTYKGTVQTDSSPLADPLANLPVPIASGPVFNNTNIGGSKTVTLHPGTYKGGIHLSGNANVTLAPGVYYLQGGGLQVSGNVKLTGTGVMIYNAPKNNGDTINISGTAKVTLTAATSGTYQGIVIFQARTSAAQITVSNAGFKLTGIVYAANALVVLSGNGNAYINGFANETVLAALIVKDLLDSGDGSLYVNAIGGGVEGDLAITKEDDMGGSSIEETTGAVTAGGTITYTIVVTNNGPSDVIGANVSDVFPSDITADTYTAVATGGATDFKASGSSSINDTVNLPTGSTITYTVTAKISSEPSGDTLSNTATVTPPSGALDPDLGNNSATDTDTFSTDVDLGITKSDDQGGNSVDESTGTVVPGGTVTYTIVVTNSGPATATDAAVLDVFDAQITGDTFTAVGSAGTSGFTASGTGNISDFVTVPAGGSITYTVTATIASSASGLLTNIARVTQADGITDTNPDNNVARDDDNLTPQADLAVTKVDNVGGSSITPSTGSVAAGGTLIYTITVSNLGPSDVLDANFSDVFPSAISNDIFTSVQSGGAIGATQSGSGTINNDLFLPSGSSVTYTVVATISILAPVDATMGNTATATILNGMTDTNPSNNSATDLDLITPGNIVTNGG